jgi:predicted RNase H-like HicB family nuclease
MRYQLLVQSQPDHSYVAAVLGVPDCVAAGQTKEEAIANAKAALTNRLAKSEIVTIEVESPAQSEENPLLKHFGRFKDDPTFDDFLERIAEYRRQVDEEEARR